MEDICVLLERVGLLRCSQSDTETVVKTIRDIEPRFSAFDEVKESKGKRDREKQEIFLHENRVSLEKLPLEDLNQQWLKKHLPSLKRKEDAKALSVQTFLKKDVSRIKFLEE